MPAIGFQSYELFVFALPRAAALPAAARFMSAEVSALTRTLPQRGAVSGTGWSANRRAFICPPGRGLRAAGGRARRLARPGRGRCRRCDALRYTILTVVAISAQRVATGADMTAPPVARLAHPSLAGVGHIFGGRGGGRENRPDRWPFNVAVDVTAAVRRLGLARAEVGIVVGCVNNVRR